jgi:hypothetical protein
MMKFFSYVKLRSDALVVGEFILSVNGIRTSGLKHEEIINLLKNAGDKVTLEVEYEMPEHGEYAHVNTHKHSQIHQHASTLVNMHKHECLHMHKHTRTCMHNHTSSCTHTFK